jgi:hypothetical protein
MAAESANKLKPVRPRRMENSPVIWFRRAYAYNCNCGSIVRSTDERFDQLSDGEGWMGGIGKGAKLNI